MLETENKIVLTANMTQIFPEVELSLLRFRKIILKNSTDYSFLVKTYTMGAAYQLTLSSVFGFAS